MTSQRKALTIKNVGQILLKRGFISEEQYKEINAKGESQAAREYTNSTARSSESPTASFVTGPTGSGKTTTLYSSLRALASPEVNIVTVEDPIEMVVEEFNQVGV
jgi:general secretion pathway protein E